MESLWTESVQDRTIAYPRLEGDTRVQVLIVGGGLAGILCARLLTDAGLECLVVEQGRIGRGATGLTTAKVTLQHGLEYADMIERIGLERTRLYQYAQQDALLQMQAMADAVSCDHEYRSAYVYSTQGRAVLEREAAAYEALDMPYHLLDDAPLPFEHACALGVPEQSQFNPLKFLWGLTPGLAVCEHTKVIGVDGNRAFTDDGATITADHIVLATRYPLVNIPGWYFIKLNQYRSYILALKQAFPIDGMFIGAQSGSFSFRTYKDYLLVGGGGHKTGEAGGQYRKLREFVQAVCPRATEEGAWATQDCMSLDGAPYAGIHRNSAPELLVASGFSKWGMTSAMLAAIVLRDLLVDGQSPYDEVVSPRRKKPLGEVARRGLASAKGMLRPTTKRCSHMGCGLTHNDAEGSWDCSCHGSRFDDNGTVLDNPALKDISVS
ncbi:FAD-dependent oxidoreductase [Raoultibacter phocaeensis]|uniref:FAD-dependent oxidoreductase n=1 Tax=Raoultibacter phocaeensis TaxID=2479841 RepID=UPI0011187927|nr:FAD-dependent oxidoreductase [Raoultibacter phocaeensis]